ncbi:hypothetical protein V7S43_015444 [Phytophthora oleae]|uniref:Uncharacterized protein n=1 Tax=Phytophthora oleae TaxID=2107226 RepID=A0ABD3F0F3_9STRA
MDANFRTFVIAVRSNMLLLMALMVIGGVVFLQVVDADENRLNTVIPLTCAVDDVAFPLLGLFENALAT